VDGQRTFATSEHAPGAAREFLREALATENLDGVGAVSELLTTELVTNAVQHGRSAATVRLSTERDCLRVEVDDDSTVVPVVRPRNPARLSGYGLLLVATLSTQWGVERRPDGKTVWFELTLPPPAETTG
jgi:anti-sigma regulatory factor (Ser/Thr protein kinase)